MLFPADSQDPLIIDFDIVMPLQLIFEPAISHVWMLIMNTSDLVSNLLIKSFVVTDRILPPSVVGSA